MKKEVVKEAAEFQKSINSIRLLEFVEDSNLQKFSNEVSEHTSDEVMLFTRKETRPGFHKIQGGITHELLDPSQTHKIFDSISFSSVRRTDELVMISLKAEINPQEFGREREKKEKNQRDHLNIAHAGKSVLEDAEESLSNYFGKITQTGLFRSNMDKWKIQNINNLNPNFWAFDLTSEFDSYPEDITQFLEDKQEVLGYIGCTKGQTKIPEFEYLKIKDLSTTYFDDTSVALNAHKYCHNSLGNYRLRTVLVKLKPHRFDKGEGENTQFASQGASEFAKAYNWLFWGLKTYYNIEGYKKALDELEDANSKQKLNQLYDSKNKLKRKWFETSKHFNEIRLLVEKTPLLKSENLVVKELLSQAKDIQNYSRTLKDQILEQHNDILDKLKVMKTISLNESNIQLNDNIHQLTRILLLFTAVNVGFGLWIRFGLKIGLSVPFGLLTLYGIYYIIRKHFS